MKLLAWTCSPGVMRHIHGWATVGWLVATPPSIVWLRDSIPYLVFLSVYAIVVSHWSAYQATRTEVKQDANGS